MNLTIRTTGKAGRTLTKMVKVTVHVTDDQSVQQVALYDDGLLVRSATCSGRDCALQFQWNLRRVRKGWHTLSAIAYDGVGNEERSEPVSVYIN